MWSGDWLFSINYMHFMLYIYLIWWVEKESFGIVNRAYVPTRHSKNKIPNTILYRVIHKSLRNFRTWLRNNQEWHGRKEHINS